MTSTTLEWKTDQTVAVGKGATVQQFVASLGADKLEISVAPWGEGQLKVNGREIAHVDYAKEGGRPFVNSISSRVAILVAISPRPRKKGDHPGFLQLRPSFLKAKRAWSSELPMKIQLLGDAPKPSERWDPTWP
jgi:hypothetical protein